MYICVKYTSIVMSGNKLMHNCYEEIRVLLDKLITFQNFNKLPCHFWNSNADNRIHEILPLDLVLIEMASKLLLLLSVPFAYKVVWSLRHNLTNVSIFSNS
jgi:hypothetical protein